MAGNPPRARGGFNAASYTVVLGSHPFLLLGLTNVQWKHLTRSTYLAPQWGAEMDRKLKSFSTWSNSASPPSALKSVIAVAIAVGLIVGAFPAAVSTPGAASAAQLAVSVNRTNKGDRLPLALKRTSNVSSPAVAVKSQPPVGCDPAFSRVADPARAHIFGRCIS